MNFEDIKKDIIERIKQVEIPYKIILFGSYASGRPHASSDIDLIVVLNNFEIPKGFRERSENFLKISRALREIERKVPPSTDTALSVPVLLISLPNRTSIARFCGLELLLKLMLRVFEEGKSGETYNIGGGAERQNIEIVHLL